MSELLRAPRKGSGEIRLQLGSGDSILENELNCELTDPRPERAERRADTRRWIEAQLQRSCGASRDRAIATRILPCVYSSNITSVERIEELGEQLDFHSLRYIDVFRQARIKRDKIRKIETIASHTRESIAAIVSIIVKIRQADERGIRLTARGGKDSAQLPATQHQTGPAGHSVGVSAEIPNEAPNESMTLIIDPWTIVIVRISWELHLLRVVRASGYD